jgi:hypothetical protein
MALTCEKNMEQVKEETSYIGKLEGIIKLKKLAKKISKP